MIIDPIGEGFDYTPPETVDYLVGPADGVDGVPAIGGIAEIVV